MEHVGQLNQGITQGNVPQNRTMIISIRAISVF